MQRPLIQKRKKSSGAAATGVGDSPGSAASPGNCSGFYKNYNLFNAGFTAGLLGMFATGILRMFNIKVETVSIISEGNNLPLFVWLMVLFAAIFLVGVFVDGYYPGCFKLLMKHSGYLASNWIQLYGYGN